jgi:uncharacterized membrane protein
MLKSSIIVILSLVAVASSVSAWTPPNPSRATLQYQSRSEHIFDIARLGDGEHDRSEDGVLPRTQALIVLSAITLPIAITPEIASAATAFTSTSSLPSALAAYVHYVAMLGTIGCIVAERLTIKPNMSVDDENFVSKADIGLNIFGLLLIYSGYLRAVEYEKGFNFYAHEPIFWLKIALVGVYWSSTLFNATTLVKRGNARRNNEAVPPMDEKLSKRMLQINNAELVAIAFIPITATFMARGVGYTDDFPWQVEAVLSAIIFFGLSYKYIKEALTFE